MVAGGPRVRLEAEALVEDISSCRELEEQQGWCGGGGWDGGGQTWGREWQ